MHKLLFILFLLLASCNARKTPLNDSEPAAHSPRFHADSLRTLDRARRLYDEKRDRDAIPYLDSVFLLPACMDASRNHPDSLTTHEARHLCNRALRELMATYNILMDFEGGLRHLDSLEHLRLPFLQRYCLRGLFTAKAQMLMPLDRHTETLECLNRAMLLAEAEDSLPLPERESPEYDNYWSGAAGITYMGSDTVSTRAERAFLRVIGIARRTGFHGGLYSHSMARLADIYLHQGKYEQSIALCQEAIATCPDKPDEQGRLIAAENLAEAYRRLGLYEDALRYCAIVTDAPNDYEVMNNLRGRSYQKKGAILAEMKHPAEALATLAQADSCFDRTGNDYYKLYVAIERAHILSALPDSLERALQLFASLREQVMPHNQAFYHYYYGGALVRANRRTSAIPLLERAIPEAESISERLIAYDAARQLAKCYQHTGQHALLSKLLPRYQVLADSVASDAKIRQLASANIRFETEKKEQQNRALAAEVALKDSRLRTTLITGILCLMLAATVIVWGVMRHRALRLRHRLDQQEKESMEKEKRAAEALLHEQETQLHSLIRDRQQLNDRNLDLLRQLSDIQSTHENSCNLDSIMESLQQSLFSKEDTERFRQQFSAVYPMALNRLRNRCADLTYNDELFCMLAMLQQDNSEIARTLGISKASASKIRYRVRVKLDLPEGTDADAEIRKMMGR